MTKIINVLFDKIFSSFIMTPVIMIVIVPILVIITMAGKMTSDSLIGVGVMLSIIPLTEILTNRMMSENGLFGWHSCHWINSICIRRGIRHSDLDEYLCNTHADESRRIREYVDMVSSQKRVVTSDEAKRFKESGHRYY